MRFHEHLTTLTLLFILRTTFAAYTLVKDYSGFNCFDDWNFYGYWDNLTLGDVKYLTQEDANTQCLAYVNNAGNAIFKVDNTSKVAFNSKRNSYFRYVLNSSNHILLGLFELSMRCTFHLDALFGRLSGPKVPGWNARSEIDVHFFWSATAS
jgi:hypothetical protein